MESLKLLAHSKNKNGEYHYYEDHARSVSTLCGNFAAKFGCREFGEQIGLIHDIGKKDEKIQSILRENDPNRTSLGYDHKTEAAILAKNSNNIIMTYPLYGHHTGLPDKDFLDIKLTQQAQHNIKIETLPLPKYIKSKKNIEMLIKMLHSCLVDADYIDTELHYKGYVPTIPKYSFSEMLIKLQNNIKKKSQKAKNNKVKAIRNNIYNACLTEGKKEQGIFSLSAPTGGGKTLSSMVFALQHVIRHNLDRVIVAIPYTSIIEQTAKQYQEIFGNALVCEHHSNSQNIRFASDPWEEPVIVTTTVQLFESLFSNKPAKCRKLHNITNSVIIIDEAQCLPSKLLTSIMEILQELQQNYNVTILFATATPPQFSIIKQCMPNINEIMQDIDYSYLVDRVKVNFQQLPQTWDNIAQQIRKIEQCLCIVNTKKDAKILYEKIKGKNSFHLSTNMCSTHREKVLKKIIERLNNNLPCIVISTQLVECGVDFDFPVVFRAIAPLTSLIQSAGRCNREGLLNKGHLFVFDPIDGGFPEGEYVSGKINAWNLLRNKENIFSKKSIAKYYQALDLAIDTDSEEIQQYRNAFAFKTVAEKFQMIPKSTQSVIVRYGDIEKDIQKIIDMDEEEKLPIKIWRKIMRHSVNLYRNNYSELVNSGHIVEIKKDLALWKGCYSDIIGIDKNEISPSEDFGETGFFSAIVI